MTKQAIGKILFIGAGKMASAIAGGMLRNGFSATDIAACDINAAAAAHFTEMTGVNAVVLPSGQGEEVASLASTADIVIVAVKPQTVPQLLANLNLPDNNLLISIAAGVTLSSVARLTGKQRIIRVMPNTPALVGCGMAAWCGGTDITEQDAASVDAIFSAVGRVCQVSEVMMDAVTGLSGSGPAYVFDFIQAMADGGVRAGLPRSTALTLAAQTVFGAANMLLASQKHPAILRDMVTSPGGTTAAALAVLERNAFKGIVADAVNAAAARSAELGGE